MLSRNIADQVLIVIEFGAVISSIIIYPYLDGAWNEPRIFKAAI